MTTDQQTLLEKYTRITDELKKHNIELIRIDAMGPVLKNAKTGKELIHNLMTWQEFPEQQIIDWVVASLPNLEEEAKKV